MAGTSDPLEEMLFSEVDEKAVSDLVGSLESQLVSQSISTATHSENRGTGPTGIANHHLGKTLKTQVITTPEQQGQQKAGMHQETNSKEISSDKAGGSPSLSSILPFQEASNNSVSGVKTNNSGLQSHEACITTTLSASAVTTLASPPRISISTTSQGSLSGSDQTSTDANPPRKRLNSSLRSATRVQNGRTVTSRNSNVADTENVSAVVTSAVAAICSRAVTGSVNTTTFTLSHSSLSAQSVIPLDRGSPTIALHRLPSHIVASIAQNGNGTTVSALVRQGARIGPINSPASKEGAYKRERETVASISNVPHSKIVMSSQSSVVNSVINAVSSSSAVVDTATSTLCSVVTTGTAMTKPPVSVVGQTTTTTTVGMVPPTAPSTLPVGVTSSQSQPHPGLTVPQRIVAPQLIVRPPQQQQTTIQLPPGFTIPQGMVLVRTEMGQLVMVPQQALAQAQAQAQAQNNISPRPATPTGATFRVTNPQKSPVAAAVAVTAPQQAPVVMTPQAPALPPQTSGTAAPGAPVVSQEMQENVKKCKNFLATLIKLASHNSPSPETSKNVKSLVQDLLDAKIEPEEFTNRLQSELKSSPQPNLVPFLKKSLPALRLSLLSSQHSLAQPLQQGAKATPAGTTPAVVAGPAVRVRHPNSFSSSPGAGALPVGAQGHAAALGIKRAATASGHIRMPIVITQTLRTQGSAGKGTAIQAGKSPVGLAVQVSGNQKNKLNDPGGGSFRDDDDINDVASMAGVNLNEESARILATNSELVGTHIRSCKDEAFLHPNLLHRRILETAKKFGVSEVPVEAVTFLSHATQYRLRTVLEKVSSIAQHRLDPFRDEEWCEQSADVRSQLRFFEQLERIEKQRKDEQEREILLKAAKSRSRQEDPEQARLKQKAKEMQQQEQAQMRQRDANLTALAAIGPRKKRKMGSPGASSSGTEGLGVSVASPPSSSSPSTSSRQYSRQRITRVNLRDLIFYMEQERETARSLLLYRALLK
ncbi:LOW QUALITY PROTEIN: transcription initiation factor TFIID subunit 4 [Aplochiton taeniatus]